MHAAQLAREFGITEIVVPRFSSGFSALGCIVADMSYTQQQAVRLLSTHWDADRFADLHDGMLETLIAPLLRQGHDKAAIAVERTALVRYVGQSYAVEVPFTAPLDLERLGSDFRNRHREIYGYATEEHWEMQEPAPAHLVARHTTLGRLPARAPCGADQHRPWFEKAAPHDTPRLRPRSLRAAWGSRAAVVEELLVDRRGPPGYA